MILVIAAEADSHVPFVTRHLEARRAEYFRFDPTHFPSRAEISLRQGRDRGRSGFLRYRSRTLDLALVRSVWNRAGGGLRPAAGPKVRSDQDWWATESSSRFLSELCECIDCLWLPERPSADRELSSVLNPSDRTRITDPYRSQSPSPYNKLHQLAVASRVGFSVPRTLVTNSPDDFLEFFESCEGEIVSKRVGNLLNRRDGENIFPDTYAVRRRDTGQFQAIQYAPVALQEKIAKKFELRVTVVAKKTFSAAILSQDQTRLQIDWRHHRDYAIARYYRAHQLAEEVAECCVRVVEALGLCFGAIDLIVTPDDDHVFLEVNPNGQWLWIEELTGLPISQAIADLLMEGAA